mgnify:CR=1 FL=1
MSETIYVPDWQAQADYRNGAVTSQTIVENGGFKALLAWLDACLLYTSPSPRDRTRSRMPSSA